MSLRVCVGVLALALLLGFTGCGVATRVTLTVDASGRGTVAVTVTLDRAAVAAVGGMDRLKSELAVGDLKAAGWSVTGPTEAGGQGSRSGAPPAGTGSVVVSVSHGFSSPSEAQALMSEVAGPGVFRVQIESSHNFWHTSFHLTGAVDLTCGIGCFGDAGLHSATGNTVGVDPGALASASGQAPAHVFSFQFDGRLPGHVHAGTGGTVQPGGSVQWAPVLGQKVVLSASSQTVNQSAIDDIGGGVAAVLVALASFIVWRLGRWLRNRFRPKHTPRHRKQGKTEGAPAPAEAVTPSS